MDPGKSANGKETTTSPQIVTNQPLLTLGPAALDVHQTPSLKEVSLTGLKFTITGLYSCQITFSGSDLLKRLPAIIPPHASIVAGTYSITRQGSDQPHEAQIVSPDKVICEDPADEAPFREFAFRQGFLRTAANVAIAVLLAILPCPLPDDETDTEDPHHNPSHPQPVTA